MHWVGSLGRPEGRSVTSVRRGIRREEERAWKEEGA
jgi:hypothetical protein